MYLYDVFLIQRCFDSLEDIFARNHVEGAMTDERLGTESKYETRNQSIFKFNN